MSFEEELEDKIVKCVTDMIEEHLARYFEPDYKTAAPDKLMFKVKDSALELLPQKLIDELDETKIASLFVKKKLADLMNLLHAKQSETPDTFTEYLINRIGISSAEKGFQISKELENRILELEYNLMDYYVEEFEEMIEESDDEDILEQAAEKTDEISLCMRTPMYEFGIEIFGHTTHYTNELFYWDSDFVFIDDIGYEQAKWLFEESGLV